MKKQLLSLLTFSLLFISTLNAQNINEQEVFVESWKKGNEQITIQTLQIKLTEQVFEIKKEILAVSGKKYLLSVVKNPLVDIKGEHWKIMMNEINPEESNKQDVCRDLLMAQKPCETGGNYFPRGNYVSYFYPYEEKRVIVNGKTSLVEWKPFYSTDTVRKILVDGFFVIIKNGKIEFDEINKSKIKSFELSIELRNSLEY